MCRTVESNIRSIIDQASSIKEVNSQIDRMVNSVMQAGYYTITATKTEDNITKWELSVNEAVYGKELAECLNAVKYYSVSEPDIKEMREQITKAVKYFVLMSL